MSPQSVRNAELAALAALRNAIGLKLMGCRFERGLTGTICVRLKDRVVGAWWHENGVYNFAPIAHSSVQYRARTTEELLTTTGAIITAHKLYDGVTAQ